MSILGSCKKFRKKSFFFSKIVRVAIFGKFRFKLKIGAINFFFAEKESFVLTLHYLRKTISEGFTFSFEIGSSCERKSRARASNVKLELLKFIPD